MRLAYTTRPPHGVPIDPESLATLQETVRLCAQLGHHVEEAAPEIERGVVIPTFITLAAVNTVVNLSTHPTAGRPAVEGEVETVTWNTARIGERTSSAHYVRGTQTAHRLGRAIVALPSRFEVLASPALCPPPVTP